MRDCQGEVRKAFGKKGAVVLPSGDIQPERDVTDARDSGSGKGMMVCYAVNLAARLYAQAVAGALAPLGIMPGQLPALLALYERDGRTQTELARFTQVEQPTMAVTLRRMERDGLITRVTDAGNRRQQQVCLTPRAHAARAAVQTLCRGIDEAGGAGLDAEEYAELRRLLARLIATLQSVGSLPSSAAT